MPFQLDFYSEMEECDQDVSVVDVYDIASEIGKEFEKIIDTHGTEAVTSLMPKVINALEHLERLATKNDRENTTVQELRARISHLEHDKIEKAEGRVRFEKELEQIEEHWRQESRDLLAMVSRLQDENRRLSSIVAEKNGMAGDGSGPGGGDGSEGGGAPSDWEMLCRLRQTVERQREAIRARDNEILAKNSELEAIQEQVERLSMVGRELRRKHHGAQAQVRGLVDERADFLAQLQDQQREIGRLRQRLGIAQKENEDLSESLPSYGERYHPDDPERPRFTTAELKEILHERNELKARVSDLEDELETYRPKPKPEVETPEDKQEDKPDEDAPVQGPLPFEPDDAPWKKSDSGIRKFWPSLGAAVIRRRIRCNCDRDRISLTATTTAQHSVNASPFFTFFIDSIGNVDLMM
ncbi:RILP-like protein homolog isoform X2 [Ischnura elegans]|uniref:RILP-like protein homolog isoform X2 n=1 Tax=Ischnura elegans TaxID=197161 RepID=UPI001ED88A3E|nr:RILP-like protein homolog isoform X2 [Ischnura elegans]